VPLVRERWLLGYLGLEVFVPGIILPLAVSNRTPPGRGNNYSSTVEGFAAGVMQVVVILPSALRASVLLTLEGSAILHHELQIVRPSHDIRTRTGVASTPTQYNERWVRGGLALRGHSTPSLSEGNSRNRNDI